MKYGIDFEDKCLIERKLQKQKDFLNNFVIDFGDKKFSLLENVYSANINPKKYFSEINNRVNSINKYAESLGLMPVFITITAPSKFHPFKTINKKKNIKIPNPNYDYENKFNKGIKEATNYLSNLWHKFTSLNLIRKMKAETGHGLIYFRVYEPHESGTPHIHALVYIPKNWIIAVKNKFKEYMEKYFIFQTKFIYKWHNNENKGAISYMMKYITKTFKHAQTLEMSDSAYWYVKHRIIRFSSSRTLVALCIYRKVRYYFKEEKDNYLYINDLYKTRDIEAFFNKELIVFRFFDEYIEENEIVLYNKRFIPNLSQKKEIIAYVDEKGKKKYRINIIKKRKKLKYVKKLEKTNNTIPLIINNEEYVMLKNGSYHKKITPLNQFTNLKLINYFEELNNNLDNINIHHYGLVKRELIKRNLINDIDIPINSYDFKF